MDLTGVVVRLTRDSAPLEAGCEALVIGRVRGPRAFGGGKLVLADPATGRWIARGVQEERVEPVGAAPLDQHLYGPRRKLVRRTRAWAARNGHRLSRARFPLSGVACVSKCELCGAELWIEREGELFKADGDAILRAECSEARSAA